MIRIRYIRASCLLIEWDGLTLLTDPWFAPRMRGLPVFVRPCVEPRALPPLDLVLVSHFHPDHFDRAALRGLTRPIAHLVTPPAPEDFFNGIPALRRNVMADGSRLETDAYRLHAVRVMHSGFELGYVVERGGSRLFFGGDARYSDVFARVGAAHNIDVALLPVGGTRIAGRRIVMDPLDAVQAGIDLRARVVIPTHEGGEWMSVPPLSAHPGRFDRFAEIARQSGVPFSVRVARPGMSVEVEP